MSDLRMHMSLCFRTRYRLRRLYDAYVYTYSFIYIQFVTAYYLNDRGLDLNDMDWAYLSFEAWFESKIATTRVEGFTCQNCVRIAAHEPILGSICFNHNSATLIHAEHENLTSLASPSELNQEILLECF